jgi:mono/diheme cytochrome c family protein
MKQLCIGTAVLGAALIGAPVLAYAQQAVDIGKREYVLSCTICHGAGGKGDGSLVEYLKKPPTNLTKIQKNNMGVFPFDRLYNAIDGREAVGAHGPREMPVWGRSYAEDAEELTSGFGITPKDRESYVRGRIIALIGYIYTLQEK